MATDNFDRTNGNLGSPWVCGTNWQIVTNKVVNTPTLGTEVFSDPGLEGTYTAGLCAGLSLVGSPTVAQSADVHGGSKAQQFSAAAQYDSVYVDPAVTANAWYKASGWIKRVSGTNGGTRWKVAASAKFLSAGNDTTDSYTQAFKVMRPPYSDLVIYLLESSYNGVGDTCVVDDISLKPITLNTLFATIPMVSADGTFSVDLTVPTQQSQAGLVIGLDSTSNPQNYITVWYGTTDSNGYNIFVEECVSGTLSRISSTMITYSYGAGKTLQAVKSGTGIDVYYDGSKLNGGSPLTITANAYTNHGIFSTDPENSLDNYVYPDQPAASPGSFFFVS